MTSLISLTLSKDSNGCRISIQILNRNPVRIVCSGVSFVFLRIKKPNGINNDIFNNDSVRESPRCNCQSING